MAAVGTLGTRGYSQTRFNPKLTTDGWKVVKVEKTERVTMNVVILLNQACLEPLAAQKKPGELRVR